MAKVIISFVTRPGHGSEGGVGWAFLKAAIEYSRRHSERVYAIIDSRDETEVRESVIDLAQGVDLVLSPVSMPRWLSHRFGDSRSRLSYLCWFIRARKTLKVIEKTCSVDLIHQVTFATAVLPAVLPSKTSSKRIWGPLNVPLGVDAPYGHTSSPWKSLAFYFVRRVGLFNIKRADLLIASNELAASFFSRTRDAVIVEPNIFLDNIPTIHHAKEKLISTVGLLNNVKRPWLAIEVLAHPSLINYRIEFVGNGPVLPQLKSLAIELGVSDRVKFHGRLSREETLKVISRSRLLLHPSVREGSPWAVGEAAALGVPAVVFENTGAATTVMLSDNGGEVVGASENLVEELAFGVRKVLERRIPPVTNRWNSDRAIRLLEGWWRLE